MNLKLTSVMRGYLRGLITGDEDKTVIQEEDREEYRELMLAKLDELPNYLLGVVYFDESKRYRMPLKVERGRVWFVAPDVLDNGHGERRLHVTSLPEDEFNKWALDTRFVEHIQLSIDQETRIWKGL